MKKKKYLLTRFGGIGDSAPIMVVAKQLKKLGHTVDIALREDDHGSKQVELLTGTDCCDNAMTFKEIGPWKTRCVSHKFGWVDITNIYANYDEVIDYMHIIEYNDTCKSSFQNGPTDEWKKHRNSNWTNWYDLHLAWANIDPTSVPDEEKRPQYTLSDEELKEVSRIKLKYSNSEVIVLNPNASSLARTWYQAKELIKPLLKKYPGAGIFFWSPSKSLWEVFTTEGVSEYQSPIKSSLRASMCVVGAADVYVGADTGFTHIAEGLEIPHVAIYSSVPGWTRAQYYKHQTIIDNGYYSFSLTLGDPYRIVEGLQDLSKQDKKLMSIHESGVSIQEAARKLNTTPEGVNLQMQAVKTRIESFERVQSKSISKVTVKEILGHINRIIEGSVL